MKAVAYSQNSIRSEVFGYIEQQSQQVLAAQRAEGKQE